MAKRKAIPQPGMSRKATDGGKLKGPEGSKEALSDTEIVSILEGYRQEAEQNRRSGFNPRDDKWTENLNAYWNRWDFGKKAEWQSKEVLGEVPSYVDRFAASMKEALITSPDGFYTISDPADTEKDMTGAIKKMEDVWLARCGRNASGDPLAFPSVFEEQMKMGSIAACNVVVLWKEDVPEGRVAVETLDPRSTWLDHTYRGLYRVRRTQIDRHEVFRMAQEKDGAGRPLFNLPEIERLCASFSAKATQEAEELSGTGQMIISKREPVTLDEYYADIIGNDGRLAFAKSLAVVGNQQFLLRAPEANPFLHKRDWVIYAPLVPVPLSPYGRSYMEDFGSIAKAFNELTNMILDAIHTSALKAFVMVPSMLMKPEQINSGISPNKIFMLEDGMDAKAFAAELNLGGVHSDAFKLWQAFKGELTEAAKQNEIGIGQFAPKGRTSATEISSTQQSSSAMIRSIAETVETTFLNPLLDLIWKTGLQHVSSSDKLMRRAAGDEMFQTLTSPAIRRELAGSRLTFRAEGISRLIERSSTLRSLIQLLQVVAANDILLQTFLKAVDINKLVELLFELSNIDIKRLQSTDRQRMLQGPVEQLTAAREGAEARTGGPATPNSGEASVAQDAAQIISALVGGQQGV